MITRKTFLGLAAATIAASALGAFGLAPQQPQQQRSDCPGKIICPLTGELVCRDRCPAVDQQRDDCPGRIECPINGELVCKDRCPLGEQAANDQATELPACCRARN